MRIVACFKVSPEAQDIQARPDRSLNLDRAVWKIGTYDLNAIEAARQLADQVGDATVIGLSAGGSALANAKLSKDALSRGLDELATVVDEALPMAEPFQTADILARAVGQLSGVDLVILGAGSSDVYAQQVGNQLGAILGWPTLNAVETIAPQGDHVTVERPLEDGVQVVEVALPAVLSVTSGANTPRIPGMRDVLAAGKKPTTTLEVGPVLAPTARLVSELASEQVDRRHIVIEGAAADAAAELATYLKAL
ncbi:MAG: putative electron transfer flavoprotein FixA [Propionibacteriaceae bacterium]|nr:putative electron transfer flavoprotein FixA [Propionibacteriaceae bacterium]